MKEEECSHPFNRDKWKEVEREDGLREWSLTFNQRQGGGGVKKTKKMFSTLLTTSDRAEEEYGRR